MPTLRIVLAAVIMALPFTSPTMSQTQVAAPAAAMPPASNQSSIAHISTGQRAALARELVAKWLPVIRKRPEGGADRFAKNLPMAAATADAANLMRATTATSVDQLFDILNGYVPEQPFASPAGIGNGAVTPMVLGSVTNDLVYTPLPNGRCRIADSRNIASPLPAGGTRSFWLEFISTYSDYGGTGTVFGGNSSTACGIPGYGSAYVLSVTLLSPTGNGVFKAFQYGMPAASGNSILFNAGDFGANGDLIVRNCRSCAYEISINSSGAAVHYVIDVIGYFMPPQATPLQCYQTSWTTHNVAVGAVFDVYAPGCAAGYVPLDTTCQAGNFGMHYVHMGLGQCAGINQSGVASWAQSSRQCCRVPGR
jgi:hypothetical protein